MVWEGFAMTQFMLQNPLYIIFLLFIKTFSQLMVSFGSRIIVQYLSNLSSDLLFSVYLQTAIPSWWPGDIQWKGVYLPKVYPASPCQQPCTHTGCPQSVSFSLYKHILLPESNLKLFGPLNQYFLKMYLTLRKPIHSLLLLYLHKKISSILMESSLASFLIK